MRNWSAAGGHHHPDGGPIHRNGEGSGMGGVVMGTLGGLHHPNTGALGARRGRAQTTASPCGTGAQKLGREGIIEG